MPDLTFGEQVKIILSRKGMTIKELAELIEKKTGKKMSRQNLTQRLGRDNFQEQDMRMIAEILECPFHMSILLDGEAAGEQQSTAVIEEKVQPTTKERVRIAKAKARKEKKAKEAERLADAIERIPSEIETKPNEKEMTLGDYIDIHEELERQETGRIAKAAFEEEESRKAEGSGTAEEYAEDTDIEENADIEEDTEENTDTENEPEDAEGGIAEEVPRTTLTDAETLAEVEQAILELKEMEKEVNEERMRAAKERERQQQEEEKKVTGWRAMFQRRTKKEKQEEIQEEERIEQEILSESEPDPELVEIEDDFIDFSDSDDYGEPEEPEPELEEAEEEYEELDDEEDLDRGEMNPYTGHEYETNSVRMHPKRIGYVQLYDRGDHAWTDMTEWAFLGYQERKKALLGKDYEPPIYLD